LTEEKKPATVNRHLATLKHMFAKAVEWELLDEDTLKRVRRAKQLQENNRRLRYSHLAPAHKTAALAVLDGAFNGHPNCTITAQSHEKGATAFTATTWYRWWAM